jgi:hypothetical protein
MNRHAPQYGESSTAVEQQQQQQHMCRLPAFTAQMPDDIRQKSE